MANKREAAFITDGFCNWKDARDSFGEHERSGCHITANTYQNVIPKCNKVPKMLDATAQANMKSNRKCLINIIETLLYLARQGVALRGHVDIESNFMQLLELRANDVPQLRDWLNKPKRADTYTSHDPQNDILKFSAHSIICDIVFEIKTGRCVWFSLIADEYSDIANKEQLSINVRWIDNKIDPHEDFLGFYEIPNIKSSTICEALKDALVRIQLAI